MSSVSGKYIVGPRQKSDISQTDLCKKKKWDPSFIFIIINNNTIIIFVIYEHHVQKKRGLLSFFSVIPCCETETCL